ncbi:GNAT family N-acetyltransferase [Kitasatospora cineracea]|uniref:GNAT family N-acetyltransferase n=1 Tax=Kitasatospora cineracea TaxID=88074 RepID=UPI0036A92E0D
MTVEPHRFTTLTADVRQALLAAYADVRAPLLDRPNYRLEAFTERLEQHAATPGFTLVLALATGRPDTPGPDAPGRGTGGTGGIGTAVGYAYGNTVGPGDGYWQRLAEPLPAGFTATPVLALREIGVRPPWRGTGAARRIHDALLADRPEQRVALMVNPLAGEGKVLRLYEGWGYRGYNSQAGTPLSPELTAMIRPIRPIRPEPAT